jgi:8-oxo-dGTP diphosphatase
VLNALFRLGYRCAYRAALIWWFITRPRTSGAVVAVWSGGRILLVRTSYRAQYTAPGGFVRRSETRAEGAARELHEETGLQVEPSALRSVWEGVLPFEFRQDGVTIFELELPQPVALEPNQRELVWAGWKTRDEALALPLSPHVRDYLTARRI